MYLIPATSEPNQTFQCIVPVDGGTRTFEMHFSYNAVAEYWEMSASDVDTGEELVTAVPLLSGEYPAANLLEQFAFLGMGAAVMVPVGLPDRSREPSADSLGSEYVLVWSDTQ